MPKFVYTEEEVPQFELLKPGNYAFEVVGYESTLGSGKASANAKLRLKCRFFNYPAAGPVSAIDWKKPVGQRTEELMLPIPREDCVTKEAIDRNVFFGGTCNMFVKCTGMVAQPGQEIELDGASVLGLRGICYVGYEKPTSGAHAGETFNRIKSWCTDKPKIARNVPVVSEEETPF